MKKIIITFLFSLVCIISLFFLFDLTNFDTKYVNRGIFEIDRKNLNSKYSKKFFNYLRYSYLRIFEKVNVASYNKRWGIEDSNERLKLPRKLSLILKKDGYSNSLYEQSEHEISNNWFRSHGNNFSTRFSSIEHINLLNAHKMKLAWIYEPKDNLDYIPNIQANPLYFDGLIYTSNSQNQIVAIDPINGKEKWIFNVDEGTAAKRGLVIFNPKSSKSLPTAVAQKQHNPIIFFTDNRKYLYALDAYTGKLIKNFGKNGKINVGLTPIPPIIYKNDLIVIDTKPILKVFDLHSGKIKWKFKINKDKPSILYENFFKGSPWGGFSLDEKRGLIFFTTGNPEQWHVGTDRPGDNLYANSVVAFDLNLKKIKWHFQETPHDLWNFDLAATPILTTIKRENKDIDVVVAVSKSGNTFVLDRDTGLSVFKISKKRSPTSDVPGEKTSPYQLEVDLPEPICRNKMTKEQLSDLPYVDKKKLLDVFSKSETGFPIPPKIKIKNIQLGGCARWAGASIDTKKNIMYISTDQSPVFVSIKKFSEWVGQYIHVWEKFIDKKNYPAIKPPWGSIVALNLNSGKILWQVPFGEWEDLKKINIKKTGTFNRAGLSASRGDLIFASGTQDNKFIVLNSLNGEELWSYRMTHPGSAPPLIFENDNKQFVIVPSFEKGGKKIYAFTKN